MFGIKESKTIIRRLLRTQMDKPAKVVYDVAGSFVVFVGFTVAVCVEAFAYVVARKFLIDENKRIDEEMKKYK